MIYTDDELLRCTDVSRVGSVDLNGTLLVLRAPFFVITPIMLCWASRSWQPVGAPSLPPLTVFLPGEELISHPNKWKRIQKRPQPPYAVSRSSHFSVLTAHTDLKEEKNPFPANSGASRRTHGRVSDRLLRTWQSYGALAWLTLTEEHALM